MLNGMQPSPLISTKPTLNQFDVIWLLHSDAYYCRISCLKQKSSPHMSLPYLVADQE